MDALNFIRRVWRRLCGWHDCPCCGEQKLRYHSENPIHEDGPPIFVWWQCYGCDRATEPEGSWLMNDAARKHGYADFREFIEANFPEDGETK